MKRWRRDAETSSELIKWLRHAFAKKSRTMQLTQAEFSKILGISRGAISNYETRRRQPNAKIREKIIQAAQEIGVVVTEDDFFYDDKKTAEFKANVTKHIRDYWSEMKQIDFLFEAYEFIYYREKAYHETGKYFKNANFPFPPQVSDKMT